MLQPDLGWIWSPGSSRIFKAGDVYWMRGKDLIGWGPLAPGETWGGSGMPALYLKSNTTFARYAPSADLREIDPTGFDAPPREPLASAAFSMSPAPPRLNQERVEFVRDAERAGLIRLSPAPPPPATTELPKVREPERAPVTRVAPPPQMPMPEPVRRVAAEPPAAGEPIVESFYAMPIYTGIIIMNPPEKKPPAKPGKRRGKDEKDSDEDETGGDGSRRRR